MFGFLKPARAIERLPAESIDPTYKRLRREVFAGIFLGYTAYYVVRTNLSLAVPDILKEHPEYTKAQLGTAMTGLSIAYGFSKFFMGSISDRSNPKYFLPLGLLLSCAIMFLGGTVKAIYSSLALIIGLQVINGWVQGMGWPPCGKTMVHWFSTKERGLTVSFWNLAHNVGGAVMPNVALLGLTLFHDWGAKLYFNAVVVVLYAGVAYLCLRDTPQSCGLPPIEEYKNDYPPAYSAEHERTFTFREILVGHVLNNKFLWAIALANAFVYFVRYGVLNWIPTYLQQAKGFSFRDVSSAITIFELSAIPGTIACGWMSDKLFKSRRAPATMLFMFLALGGIILYWFNRQGPFWVDQVALGLLGFAIYGPIMMIGLHALDLVPKKAAGTAAGFTGVFGYVVGAALSGTGVGVIEGRWGWGGVFMVMIACCLLAIGCYTFTLGHRAESSAKA